MPKKPPSKPEPTPVPCEICAQPTSLMSNELEGEYAKMFPNVKPTCKACNDRYDAGERYDWDKRVWYRPETKAIINPRQLAWETACAPSYRNTDSSHPGFPLEKWYQVEQWKYGKRGLILSGPTDSYKSRCMFLLLKRLMLTDGYSARVFYTEQWSEFVAMNCRGDENAMIARRTLHDTQLLVFDDLFAEPMTERAESLLLSTIDARLREEKPMLITTMFTGDSVKFLDPTRGGAVIRRLRQCCENVMFGAAKGETPQ